MTSHPFTITAAYTLAVSKKKPLLRSHLEVVIDLEEFQKDFNGAGQIANNMSYVTLLLRRTRGMVLSD